MSVLYIIPTVGHNTYECFAVGAYWIYIDPDYLDGVDLDDAGLVWCQDLKFGSKGKTYVADEIKEVAQVV